MGFLGTHEPAFVGSATSQVLVSCYDLEPWTTFLSMKSR
jgi:hypothetical protein